MAAVPAAGGSGGGGGGASRDDTGDGEDEEEAAGMRWRERVKKMQLEEPLVVVVVQALRVAVNNGETTHFHKILGFASDSGDGLR